MKLKEWEDKEMETQQKRIKLSLEKVIWGIIRVFIKVISQKAQREARMKQVAERREIYRSQEQQAAEMLEKQAAELQNDLLKQYRNFSGFWLSILITWRIQARLQREEQHKKYLERMDQIREANRLERENRLKEHRRVKSLVSDLLIFRLAWERRNRFQTPCPWRKRLESA